MRITIHQAEHLPHLSLLHKFSQADIIVLFDTAQYKKSYFENRNKIRINTEQGWDYVTVPVEGSNHKPMNQVLIADLPWRTKYLQKVKSNYTNSPYFKQYYTELEEILIPSYTHIVDLNIALIRWLLDCFAINKQVILTSELELNNDLRGSERLLDICKKTGATEYLSGPSGKDYLDAKLFENNGIKVSFHEFFHPVYKQQYEPFMVGMSSIDALFNYGTAAKNLLYNKGRESIKFLLNKIKFNNKWRTLEAFGGDGSGQLSIYGTHMSSLDIWEIDNVKVKNLQKLYPQAYICKVDTLREIKTCQFKYDLIVLDPPALMAYNGMIKKAANLLNPNGWIIFREIHHSYNGNPDITCGDAIKEILTLDREILKIVHQPREYYDFKLWLSNYAIQLK